MTNVYFQPWIGEKYESKENLFNGKRVLVVGDSHYCRDKNGEYGCKEWKKCGLRGMKPNQFGCKEFTKEVVAKHIKEPLPIYTNFEKYFGKLWSKVTSNEVWNSLAFYNFVQTASSEDTKYSDDDYEKSVDAFVEVVENLNPDYIIVWGQNVWKYIPDDKETLRWNCDEKIKKGLEGDGFKLNYGFYEYKNKKIHLMKVIHPSPRTEWRQVECEYCAESVKKFLEL